MPSAERKVLSTEAAAVSERREPETPSKVYLSMIEADPEGVRRFLAKV